MKSITALTKSQGKQLKSLLNSLPNLEEINLIFHPILQNFFVNQLNSVTNPWNCFTNPSNSLTNPLEINSSPYQILRKAILKISLTFLSKYFLTNHNILSLMLSGFLRKMKILSTGPSWGERACFRDAEYILFEILD